MAKENIPVFKVMDIKDGQLYSINTRFKYTLGETYSDTMDEPVEGFVYGSHEINAGFHSYSIRCGMNKMLKHNYYFVTDPLGSILDQSNIKIRDYRIVKVYCIIPKDSYYYENERGECVSDKIKIVSYEEL